MRRWLRARNTRGTVAVGFLSFALALGALAIANHGGGSAKRLSSGQAVRSALADPAVARHLARFGYTRERVMPLDDEMMRVSFFNRSRAVLEAAVAPDGSVPHRLEYKPGYVRAGSRTAQTPLALLLLSAVFALATACVPLRRLRNLDVLALLSFGVSIVLLNERLFELSVWASVPPLVYLGLRCLWVGLAPGRPRPAPEKPARSLYDTAASALSARERLRILRIGFVAAALGLVILSVPGGFVGDVGFASMAGATQLLHGTLPYGHLPPELVHGDTYPLLAYATYIPAALVTPVDDAFDNLDGALVITAVAALLAAMFVYAISNRLAGDGRNSTGLRNAIAWLTFPPVLIAASSGSNDLVAAAFVAGALALALHAGRSTIVLTLAGWIKLVPLFLVPVSASRFRLPKLLRASAAAAAVTGGVLGWIVLAGGPGGINRMLEAVSFQTERGSILSIWTLVALKPLQLCFQAAVLSLLAVAALRLWRDRALAGDLRRLAALCGAIMIGFQLGANYWSYAYLPWVLPCIMLALLVERESGKRQSAVG